MKKAFFYTILFFTIIFFIDFFAGILIKNVLDKGGGYGHFAELCEIKNYVLSDIVILGSSRAEHHYNPREIAKSLNMSCYNCGRGGQGIINMYGRYLMLNERYSPKVLIYDYFPSFDYEKGDNTKYTGELRPFSFIPSIKNLICDIDSMEQYKLYSNLYKINGRYEYFIIPHSKRYEEWTQQSFKSLDGYYRGNITQASPMEPDNLKNKYFEKLINEASKKSTVIIVISPILKTNIDFSFAQMVAKKYDVTLLDFSDSIKENRFYKDASHLNKEGANLFNKLLIKELLNFVKIINLYDT